MAPGLTSISLMSPSWGQKSALPQRAGLVIWTLLNDGRAEQAATARDAPLLETPAAPYVQDARGLQLAEATLA